MSSGPTDFLSLPCLMALWISSLEAAVQSISRWFAHPIVSGKAPPTCISYSALLCSSSLLASPAVPFRELLVGFIQIPQHAMVGCFFCSFCQHLPIISLICPDNGFVHFCILYMDVFYTLFIFWSHVHMLCIAATFFFLPSVSFTVSAQIYFCLCLLRPSTSLHVGIIVSLKYCYFPSMNQSSNSFCKTWNLFRSTVPNASPSTDLVIPK